MVVFYPIGFMYGSMYGIFYLRLVDLYGTCILYHTWCCYGYTWSDETTTWTTRTTNTTDPEEQGALDFDDLQVKCHLGLMDRMAGEEKSRGQ